ncbi:MAG: 6-phosphogluconolactonase [Pseudomonadota bacterium]
MFIQQFFDDRARASEKLADDIARELVRGLSDRGSATLVVSGGSSPLDTFRQLRDKDLDWSKVTVVPSDERWIDVNEPASNAGMLHRELLVGKAAAARFVSLYDGAVELADAAHAMSARVDKLKRPFDYVLLGMGSDGHTASLFPDDPEISHALSSSNACVVANPPSQPLHRVSLTPQVLLDSRAIGLLFFGQEKADVFSKASLPGDLSEFPVRSVLRQELVPVTTYFAL